MSIEYREYRFGICHPLIVTASFRESPPSSDAIASSQAFSGSGGGANSACALTPSLSASFQNSFTFLNTVSHRPSESTTPLDRKSTRLNSSHTVISYAVFCLKKKTSQR